MTEEKSVAAIRLTQLAIWGCLALSLASARSASGWRSELLDGGCLGGKECAHQREIALPLEDAPVLSVRFFAHDDVGVRTLGRLRVRIDDRVLTRSLTLDKNGRTYTLGAEGYRGGYLIFEAAGSDEVVVESIEIEYAGNRDRNEDPERRHQAATASDDWQVMGRGWQRYRLSRECFGGARCPGRRLVVDLLDASVYAVRFYAHDRVGDKHGGRLRIELDRQVLEHDLDIKKDGQTHYLDVSGKRGRTLTFEALEDDEVVLESLEVQYREEDLRDRRDRSPPPPPRSERPRSRYDRGRPYGGPGECLGGDLCGRRRSLEIVVDSRPIHGVRFFAHSDVGDGSRGRLQVLLDREVLAEDLEVPRRGDFFEIAPSEAVEGRYLVFEVLGYGEVVLEDIEVNHGGSWVRYRVEDAKDED